MPLLHLHHKAHGLLSQQPLRTRCIIKVENKSSEGERYPYGGLQVKAELRPKSRDGVVVPGKLEDLEMVPTPSPLRLLVLTSSSSQWMVNMYRAVLMTLM